MSTSILQLRTGGFNGSIQSTAGTVQVQVDSPAQETPEPDPDPVVPVGITSNILYIDENIVTFGDNFSSDNNYIVKEPNNIPDTLLFTKTLSAPSLLIYQETDAGRLLNYISDNTARTRLQGNPPVNGPFIPGYSYKGSLKNEDFINLLLIDKPPIRTGYFEFQVAGISFTGFITKLTKYEHWNWQLYFGSYNYIKQSSDISYGIEISNNLLYTAKYENEKYTYTPTAIYNTLSGLTGSEEIVSFSTTSDPNLYLNSVEGDGSGVNTSSLPIDIFYISPADALRYIASHSDLIEEFGANVRKGQEHFAQFKRRINFNPISYLNNYSDIRNLYGYDTYNATIHFIEVGYNQGRTSEGGSAFNNLAGGLYDERYGGFGLSDGVIVWANGATIGNSGRSISYKFYNTSHYLNGQTEIKENITFLRRL